MRADPENEGGNDVREIPRMVPVSCKVTGQCGAEAAPETGHERHTSIMQTDTIVLDGISGSASIYMET